MNSLERYFLKYYVLLLMTLFSVDLWSVGCIMAEMLTGKTLFPGTDRKFLIKQIYIYFTKLLNLFSRH